MYYKTHINNNNLFIHCLYTACKSNTYLKEKEDLLLLHNHFYDFFSAISLILKIFIIVYSNEL